MGGQEVNDFHSLYVRRISGKAPMITSFKKILYGRCDLLENLAFSKTDRKRERCPVSNAPS